MKRLPQEKFIEAVKFAPDFILRQNRELNEVELIVIDGTTTRHYLGPMIREIGQSEYMRFLKALDEVTRFEELRQKMWEIY